MTINRQANADSGLIRGRVGRADMLSALIHRSRCDLAVVAECVGFVSKTPLKSTNQTSSKRRPDDTAAPLPGTQQSDAGVLSFVHIQQSDSIDPDQSAQETPAWFEGVSTLNLDDAEGKPKQSPPKPPLMRWSRLWPFLKIALGALCDSCHLDEHKLVRCLAQGEQLKRLPFQQTQGWAPSVHIVVDHSARLLPFWQDFNALCQAIQRLHGHAGLTITRIKAAPDTGFNPQIPILVLSDLGFYAPEQRISAAWGRWAQRLHRAGRRPVVLTPCPSRLWDATITQHVFPVCWDKTSRLPRQLKGHPPCVNRPEINNSGVALLLAMASPAIRVEPDLLRAIRCRLPTNRVDVGCEAEAWLHADTHSTPLAFAYDPNSVDQHHQHFKIQDKILQKTAIKTIVDYHAASPKAIIDEEQRNMAVLSGAEVDESIMKQVVKSLFQDDFADADALRAWVGRFGQRQKPAGWDSDIATAAWVKAHEQALKAGKIDIPKGLDLQRAAWVLGSVGGVKTRQIRQQGSRLRLIKNPSEQPLQKGCRVGDIRFSQPRVVMTTEHHHCAELITQELKIELPPSGNLTLTTDLDSVVLQQRPKPAWAVCAGQDLYGWFAEFEVNHVRQTMRWINPGTFMMGSPETEKGRSDGEHLHRVKLTQGFWLADTACTQAMWRVVMGDNPSHSRGDNKPVEQVSWNDVQQFLQHINAAVPGLALCLPTEAQWEYACRAGSTSAYAFGDDITSKQVNVVIGKVAVKSLPSNSWALYDMHGNVGEWCSDRMGDYSPGNVADPAGPAGSAIRAYQVLRGGSWINGAQITRSADRNSGSPVRCNGNIGFRLARGQ